MPAETLGFAELYDYVAGKVDRLAHNQPIEGDHASVVPLDRIG